MNNGTKTFTLKYGFNPRYFRKYYLKGDDSNPYNGPLNNPKMNLEMFIDYLINKLKFILSIFSKDNAISSSPFNKHFFLNGSISNLTSLFP